MPNLDLEIKSAHKEENKDQLILKCTLHMLCRR